MFKTFKNSAFYKKHQYRLKAMNEQLSVISAILLMLFISADTTYQVQERRFMISEIQMTALVTGLYTGHYKVDSRVLNAMSRIPRENFIDRKYARYAFQNVALPMMKEKHIIPEPFLTAMMIHLMGVHPEDTVMEIGFGTGYEAAVLSKLTDHVYSLHQKNPLGESSYPDALKSLQGYRNVTTMTGDGIYGWPGKKRFDAILVKQALNEEPKHLVNQLKPYGRLVVPIVDETGQQVVMVYLKLPDGSVEKRETLYVKTTALMPGQDI